MNYESELLEVVPAESLECTAQNDPSGGANMVFAVESTEIVDITVNRD